MALIASFGTTGGGGYNILAGGKNASSDNLAKWRANLPVEDRAKLFRDDIIGAKVVEMYLSGISMEDIAKEFSCSTTPISKRLKDAGVCIRTGASATTAKRRLASAENGRNRKGILLGPRTTDRKNHASYRHDLDLVDWASEYSKLSSVKLAEKYSCSIPTAQDRIKRAGIKMRLCNQKICP